MTSDALFRPACGKGATLERHNNTMGSAHNIIRIIMENRPEIIRSQQVQPNHMDMMEGEDDSDVESTLHGSTASLQELPKADVTLKSSYDGAAELTQHDQIRQEHQDLQNQSEARIEELERLLNEERTRSAQLQNSLDELSVDHERTDVITSEVLADEFMTVLKKDESGYCPVRSPFLSEFLIVILLRFVTQRPLHQKPCQSWIHRRSRNPHFVTWPVSIWRSVYRSCSKVIPIKKRTEALF